MSCKKYSFLTVTVIQHFSYTDPIKAFPYDVIFVSEEFQIIMKEA